MIKAIMLDVDGTLVSFETHKVLPSSVDALRKIHDGGIRIVIATGRAAGDLHEIADVPYDGIIALNGADCVLRDGTVIRKHLIPKDDFKKAMEIAKTFDFAVAIELDEGVFVNRLTPTVEQIAKIVEHPIPTVVDIENLFEKKECCQLCFYIDDEMEQKVMSFLPNLSLSRWHPLFADVNVVGTSKAHCFESVTHLKAARSATSVLPKPTSPQSSLSIGTVRSISSLISSMQRSWSGVSSYSKRASKSFCHSVSFGKA